MGVQWFRNQVVYQIFIDRFAGFKSEKGWNKPKFLGGNTKGIIKNLDYLEELGVTCLWLSPFFKGSAYHGYHTTDFFKVEPNFGTLADVKRLIKEVHKRKMKIITDFVPNHVSYKHPYFLDAQKNQKSKYSDWFIFKKWPKKYMCFLTIKDLPKLNLENKETEKHVIDAAKYWLKLGIDGFRLDHVVGPTYRFWKKFRKDIKKDFPNKVLIGEVWIWGVKFKELKTINLKNKFSVWAKIGSKDKMYQEYVGILDGILDFNVSDLLRKYGKKKISLKRLHKKLKKHYGKFPKKFLLPLHLDNHDIDRFSFVAKNDTTRIKQTIDVQFSQKQPVIIYYGDECGMTQKKSLKKIKSHGDLQARQPMTFKKGELYNYYKQKIKEFKQL